MELLSSYERASAFDEAVDGDGRVREHYAPLAGTYDGLDADTRARRQRAAELFFRNRGTTFTVYGEKAGIDRVFPFDSVPRVLPGPEWYRIERGLKQRLRALNLF